MANRRTASEEMEAIFDAIGESICNESDEEILEDLRQVGIDPDAEAVRLTELMLNTLEAFQQQRLVAARAQYKRRIEQLEERKYRIPRGAKEQRSLFSLILRQPRFADLITAQYRELKDLTDTDIETYLEDLAELGILEELDQTDGEE